MRQEVMKFTPSGASLQLVSKQANSAHILVAGCQVRSIYKTNAQIR
ncbi:lipoprotein, putative [Microscilla marina ATCC 23134]|uniref:Lipoprotein, putative n=1 Tax=Microscilla marina ATCC 23134 TaxID=313606 RepID=A1ZCW5_MICM2|nr:lipoprotein, putative [Microscilla marina ATCC 23134]